MNVPALILATLVQATPLPSPSPTPLALSASAVALQPGQTQTLAVANATNDIGATLDTPIANVTVDQTAHTVTIVAGNQPGRAMLTVTDQAGAAVTIPVRIAFTAGAVPTTLNVRVTGSPVDAQWLAAQVQRSLLKAISLQQGVSTQSVQVAPYTLPAAFAPGDVAAVPVTVHIAGGDQFLDADGTVNVSLQNVNVDAFEPPLLFYDDDPEKITGFGVLYSAEVSAASPARLYYYHENISDPRRLLVVLQPVGSGTSSVQLIDASAGPNIDVMSVGHAVSRNFLLQKPLNEGLVTDLAVNAPTIVDDFSVMQSLDGAAGSIGIRVLNGSPVTVSVLAVPPAATSADIAGYLAGPKLPGDGHHRTGVFDIRTFGQTDLSYDVGGPDVSTDYGAATPPSAAVEDGHDYGEYGVMRTIRFAIDNATQQPATLYFYEKPLGGVVRSSFLINGQLAEVGCARVDDRYQVGPPLSVNPGTSQVVVQTMTDGGSNYPLEFGLTATPPQPTTPPISSPDGCFPKS